MKSNDLIINIVKFTIIMAQKSYFLLILIFIHFINFYKHFNYFMKSEEKYGNL